MPMEGGVIFLQLVSQVVVSYATSMLELKLAFSARTVAVLTTGPSLYPWRSTCLACWSCRSWKDGCQWQGESGGSSGLGGELRKEHTFNRDPAMEPVPEGKTGQSWVTARVC